MSAPAEVWLSPGWAKHHEERVTALRDGGDKVRYLRADLTCGECELCYISFGVICNLHDHEIRTVDHPACMAFVPKATP